MGYSICQGLEAGYSQEGQGGDWLVGKTQVSGTDIHLKGQVEARLPRA